MLKEKSLYYLDNKYFDEYIENKIRDSKKNTTTVDCIDEMNCCCIEGNLWDNIVDNSELPF